MVNSRFNRVRGMAAAAAMAAAVALASPAAMVPVLAATGTVTGSDINVRSEASSDSSKVGTVTTGDTVEVGETATDSTGATWYQVTLSNGTTGYVRGDFLTVDETEDTSSETTDGTTDAADDTAADETTEGGTDAAAAEATAAAEQDTGGYQIVLAPDENGTDTYYLYNNNEGKRMKISDIQKLEDDVTTANANTNTANKKFTIVLIAAIAAVVVLGAAVVILTIRLKDALENGRRERDLTMERRDQRRSDHRADSVESLRKPRSQSAKGRSREDAYASNTVRRVERDPRDARPVGGERVQRPASRPAEGGAYTTRTRSAAPARDAEGRAVSRTPAARSAAPNARSAGGVGERPVRAAEGQERRPAPKPAARPAARNFAEDDFDYDFLKLDDSES